MSTKLYCDHYFFDYKKSDSVEPSHLSGSHPTKYLPERSKNLCNSFLGTLLSRLVLMVAYNSRSGQLQSCLTFLLRHLAIKCVPSGLMFLVLELYSNQYYQCYKLGYVDPLSSLQPVILSRPPSKVWKVEISIETHPTKWFFRAFASIV